MKQSLQVTGKACLAGENKGVNLARVPVAAFVLAIAPLIATPAAHAEPFAYVTNDEGSTVTVIDTATNTVTASVQVGLSPAGIAITPDGDFAYVANFFGGEFSDPDTVSVIDTASNTVIATVEVGRDHHPFAVAITPDSAFVYVTNSDAGTVSVIDTATNTVTATVPVGDNARGIAVTPDGAFVYVTSHFLSDVLVIDTATNTVTATVSLGSPSGDIAITPDGAFAYVASGGGISVIDIASNTVTATVPGASGQIAFTPDGAFAYVAGGGDVVSVIDTASNTVIATVPVGRNPFGIAITPDGAFAYVAIIESDVGDNSSIWVIDTATNTVADTFGSSIEAFDIAITPEPPAIEARIDIRPGTRKNTVNLRSNGNIPVAVLSTGKFDATQVDWETVTFGPDEATEIHQRSHLKDVDRDGDLDFVLHFKIRKAGIECDDRKATLSGETFNGQAFTGSDKVKIVKCR